MDATLYNKHSANTQGLQTMSIYIFKRTWPLPVFVSFISLFFFALSFGYASTSSERIGAIDEREFLLEDYLALDKASGDIVRPYRRQRNLMYRLQDALNKQDLNAGERSTVWESPFREALKTYQQKNGMEANGKITPRVVKSLLGVDLEQRLSH